MISLTKKSQNFFENVYKTFLVNKILSRWFVLVIDVGIIFFAILLSFFLTQKLYSSLHDTQNLSWYIYFIPSLLLNIVAFFYFKTYIGVIRYSTLHELKRIFLALLISNLFIFIYLYLGGAPSGTISVTYCVSLLLFSLLGLFIFRFIVISCFQFLHKKYEGKVIIVYLWGLNEATIAMTQILNTTNGVYKVDGFIDHETNNKLIKNTYLPVFRLDFLFKTKLPKDILFINEEDFKHNKDAAEKLVKLGHRIYIMKDININNLDDLLEISHNIRQIQIEDLLGRPEIEISIERISDTLSGKTVLVSGAAGSIGSEIVRQLAKFSPKKVICLDQAETPLHDLFLELSKSKLNFEVVISDVRRLNKLEHVFRTYKPQVVYHAAAYKHVPLMEQDPEEAIVTNVGGTKNMADMAVKYAAEMFVMVSTDKAVNPTNIMGASKRIAEIYVQTLASKFQKSKQSKTKFVTTRFGNVLGSNGSVIPLFKKQIEQGGPITVTHKDITRYFMTIPEACRLVLEASVIGESGYIYVFDMGEPVKIYDLALKMIELSGLIPQEDIRIKISGLRPGEKLYEELLNDLELTENTSHEKIKIAKVRQYDEKEVFSKIDKLIVYATDGHVEELVCGMKKLVPEYISKNSKFELYDIKFENTQSV